MSQAPSSNVAPVSFLETKDFLEHDPSQGRLDKSLEGGVTLSAIPDGTGKTQWEARTSDGEALPLFHMTIKRPAAAGAAPAVVFVDATEGCYICYEDNIRMESRCVSIPC